MGNALGFGAPANVAVEHESFCGRMCNSLCGVFVGMFLFFAAIVMLGWNEFNFVRNQAVLQYVQDKVVEIECQPPSLSAPSEPAWASCGVTQLYDFGQDSQLQGLPPFTTSLQGAWFQASSTIYQWTESKSCTEHKTMAGGKDKVCTYSYSRSWVTAPIDSSSFYCYPSRRSGCVNYYGDQIRNSPSTIPSALQKKYFAPDNAVTMGDQTLPSKDHYGLNQGLLSAFKGETPALLQASSTTMSDVFPGRHVVNYGGGLAGFVQNIGGTSIGDVKTQFTMSAISKGTFLSVIALLKHNAASSVWAFQSWNTGKSGTMATVNWATVGQVSEEDMINEKQSENNTLVWILRFGGFFVMFIGLHLVTGPIALAPEIIPCVGAIIGEVVGCALCCMNFAFSVMLSLLVIGIAWVLARPLFGCCILAVAAAAGAAVWYTRKRFGKRGSSSSARLPHMVAPLNEGQPGNVPMSYPVASPVRVPQMMVVTCPAGVGPGQWVQMRAPDGNPCNVAVPPGVHPGQQFEVQV